MLTRYATLLKVLREAIGRREFPGNEMVGLFDVEGDRTRMFKTAICMLAMIVCTKSKYIKESNVLAELCKIYKDDPAYAFLEAEKKWTRTFVTFKDARRILRKNKIMVKIVGRTGYILCPDTAPATRTNKQVYKIARFFLRHGCFEAPARRPIPALKPINS